MYIHDDFDSAEARIDAAYEERSTAWEKAQELREKAVSDGITQDEERSLHALLNQVQALTMEINQLESRNRREIEHSRQEMHATGEPRFRDSHDSGPAEYDKPLPENRSFRELITRDAPREDHNLSLGKAIRGVVTGRWDGAEEEKRVMSGASTGAGGALLPTILLKDVVDLARSQTQVIAAGARIVPMSNRQVVIPRWLQDPSVDWRAENGPISVSDGALDTITFNAQTLAGSTTISREIVEDSDLSGLLEGAYAKAVALAWDYAALYGSGVAPEPAGLISAGITDTSALGTNGVAFTYDHLISAVGSVRARNELARAALMAPRSMQSLGSLKDSTGRYLDPPAYIRDVRLLETGQIPITETTGTANNTSTLFVGDFRQLYLGVRTTFGVRVFDQVGVPNGQVTIVAWFRGDIQVAREGAFAIRTGLLP